MFVTSEGHPSARLQRALKAGNLIAAEQAAFEVPFVPLAEARALVELYAEKVIASSSGRRSSISPGTWPRRIRRSSMWPRLPPYSPNAT